MLQALDVLIGFTLVMLILSMAVTMITQFISSTVLNMRGMALRQGISRLLALMDEGLKLGDAKRITDRILRNPLIGGARLLLPGHDLAAVVHREELTRLILDFAIPDDAEKAAAQDVPGDRSLWTMLRTIVDFISYGGHLEEARQERKAEKARLRAVLNESLANNEIKTPQATLTKVRKELLELEKTRPELSNSVRLNMALLKHAESEYLSKFNSWFDQSVDRVSNLFTQRVWIVTALVSLFLAFATQLDSIDLMNRLSVDDQLRNELVTAALKEPESRDPALREDAAQAPQTRDELVARISEAGYADLDRMGLVSLPDSPSAWLARWQAPEDGKPDKRMPLFFGVLLTAALLSLGGPFWYSSLANLLKLRSMVARKEEVQREERQTTQTPPAVAVPAAVPVTPTAAAGKKARKKTK
jgi:hypothetical protein